MQTSDADEGLKRKWKILSDRFGRSYIENEAYFRKKWGCSSGLPTDSQTWVDLCPFETPFQQAHVPVSWWVFDHQR